MTRSYTEQVSDVFLSSNPQQFGDAHATIAELGALRDLYKQSGDRQKTVMAVAEHGYPMPQGVTAEMVALTGAAHACGVALDLAKSRGEAGKAATYESYTVKNRFDRFVYSHLPKGLRLAWNKPIDREDGFINPAMKYPDGVEDTCIYGVAKPHRYFPTQTMRYLEFARLDKLDSKMSELFGIDDETDISKFGIAWETLVPVIEKAGNIIDLSADITFEIANQLLVNGLSVDQVAAVISKGYSLGAMAQEHGQISQTAEVYDALIRRLKSKESTNKIVGLLEPQQT